MYHQRKNIRLQGLDYSSANAYFITVCVKHGEPLLGRVTNGICRLSDIGNEAAWCLQKISEIKEGVVLDEFIVMPNHLHCILILPHREHVYIGNSFGNSVAGSISVIINQCNGAVTTWCKKIVNILVGNRVSMTMLYVIKMNIGQSRIILLITHATGKRIVSLRRDTPLACPYK